MCSPSPISYILWPPTFSYFPCDCLWIINIILFDNYLISAHTQSCHNWVFSFPWPHPLAALSLLFYSFCVFPNCSPFLPIFVSFGNIFYLSQSHFVQSGNLFCILSFVSLFLLYCQHSFLGCFWHLRWPGMVSARHRPRKFLKDTTETFIILDLPSGPRSPRAIILGHLGCQHPRRPYWKSFGLFFFFRHFPIHIFEIWETVGGGNPDCLSEWNKSEKRS